jgi:membrane protease subunit HflK
LHFRLPYPIEEVHLPKVTRQNIIQIGVRSSGADRKPLAVPDESLMLTGDENIVDINFVVFWRIKDAQMNLFNILNPDITVKDVAQSAMREVVGQSNIQPLLTGARQETEQAVHKLMQGVLDIYGPACTSTRCGCRKLIPDPGNRCLPRRAGGTCRPGASAERGTRLRQPRTPEARGEAERILQAARGYKEQTVAEATGQTSRFLKVLEEYKKAPEVTRRRMYLETMERVLGGTDKIIIDGKAGQGVVPFLSLDSLPRRKEGGN